MTGNPERLQEAAPDRGRTLAYHEQLAAQFGKLDPTDLLYDIESSADYDPAPGIGRIKAPLLAINFADDEVNPAQFSVTRETIARIPSARLVLVQANPGYGHASISHAELWSERLAAFLDQLPGWKE